MNSIAVLQFHHLIVDPVPIQVSLLLLLLTLEYFALLIYVSPIDLQCRRFPNILSNCFGDIAKEL